MREMTIRVDPEKEPMRSANRHWSGGEEVNTLGTPLLAETRKT